MQTAKGACVNMPQGFGGFGGGGGARGRDDINSIQLGTQDFSNLPPFEKNFYVEHPAVTARSPADVETYRKMREIHVQVLLCLEVILSAFHCWSLCEQCLHGMQLPTTSNGRVKLLHFHVQGSGVPKPCTTFEEASFPGAHRAAGTPACLRLRDNVSCKGPHCRATQSTLHRAPAWLLHCDSTW